MVTTGFPTTPSMMQASTGTAGQSLRRLARRAASRSSWKVEANDYVGKGLSGGRIVIQPPVEADSSIVPEESIIVGNTVMYGAICRRVLFPRRRGRALRRAQLRRHLSSLKARAITAANT